MPRRNRMLVILVAFICAITFLPRSSFDIGTFSSFLIPGSSKGPVRYDKLKFVDPLIGTTNGGHVFPGASLPYGMAKPVADTDARGENAAGFVSDSSKIVGFSHMHDTGTGGQPSLGNFPLFVHPGCPEDKYENCKFTSIQRAIDRINGSVEARPGYFGLALNNSVHAEMTATEHAALYRFNFIGDELVNEDGVTVPFSPLILVDLIDLQNSRSSGSIQLYPDTGRIIGEGQYRPSFGNGNYKAYFCTDFRGAKIRRSGTFIHDKPVEDPKFLSGNSGGFSNPSGSAGAWIQFEPPESRHVFARVGLSFISTDKACMNAAEELPDFGFDRAVKEAESAWSDKLSVIEVDATGVSQELQATFWSGLYRTMLSPQNYTGENQAYNSTEPYFDSFYCIWDSYRAQHPLLNIIDPEAQRQMIRTLIDVYRHEGKLPDCRMSFCKGYSQGGSNADVMLVDSYLKNVTEGIDWKTAYEAVVSDAEEEPLNWGVEGRGNLVSYHELGYIPWDDKLATGTGPASRTVSRLLEYAYDDFAIGLLARELGHAADAQKYLARSGNWKHVWNAEQEDLYREEAGGRVQKTRFRGFVQPRLANGTWRYQNTRLCSNLNMFHSCYYDTSFDTYEGSPWLYSFYVPQDMGALVGLMGGRALFTDRLAFFHESGIAYLGNEPAYLTVYQFHYAARPGLSSYWVHEYIPAQFNASVNGIPGNDDCAMGAFSAFAFMGFFPVAGQDVYLLVPPFFPEVRIRTKTGKYAVMRSLNFDPEFKAIYIQSVKLNGKPYTKSWITHEFFINGGVLEMTVGTKEGSWGTMEEDLPPSYSTTTVESSR